MAGSALLYTKRILNRKKTLSVSTKQTASERYFIASIRGDSAFNMAVTNHTSGPTGKAVNHRRRPRYDLICPTDVLSEATNSIASNN